MTGGHVLVPVGDSVTIRNTVAYSVQQVLDAGGSEREIHFVFPFAGRGTALEGVDNPKELLNRCEIWAREDLGEKADAVDVRTALVGVEQYLFSPGDYADVLSSYAAANDIDRAILDPEYNPSGTAPLLPPLEAELERDGIAVETAPVERPTRRPGLVGRGGFGQFVGLFAASLGFYLLVSGTLGTFDLVTGAISGGIVAAMLWRVSVTGPLRPTRVLGQVGRLLLYVPFLLWEVAKANIHVAYVVLHPSLPIDPKMVEFDAAVWSELPVATLANSITLTPGTLTVDVSRRHFTIHTLTANSRDDLFDGGLERAVRFVFYGRSAMAIASPRERGEEGGDES